MELTMEAALEREEYMTGHEAFVSDEVETEDTGIISPKSTRKTTRKSKRTQRRRSTAIQKKRQKELARALGYKVDSIPQHKLDLYHEIYNKLCRMDALKRDRDREDKQMLRELYVGSVLSQMDPFEADFIPMNEQAEAEETFTLSAEQILFQERMEQYGNMTLNQLLKENPSMKRHPWVISDILDLLITLAEDSIAEDSASLDTNG